MYMKSFHASFPELAATETRTATIKGSAHLPDGEYGFFEAYCDDPACDCRRVIITVYRSDDIETIQATISYGWESLKFYERWMGNSKFARQMQGPVLEPFGEQTALAPALLELFTDMIRDEAYVQRLQRHYGLVKGTQRPARPKTATRVKRGKR